MSFTVFADIDQGDTGFHKRHRYILLILQPLPKHQAFLCSRHCRGMLPSPHGHPRAHLKRCRPDTFRFSARGSQEAIGPYSSFVEETTPIPKPGQRWKDGECKYTTIRSH